MKTVPASKRYHLILSAVHMVYRLVNSTYTVKELTLRLTRLLCQFIKASSASVYLIDPVKKHVCLWASFDNQINIWRDHPKDLKNVGEDVWSVTRGDSVMTDDCLGIPLVADDYLGAIFVRRRKNEEPFSDADHQMLSVFCEQIVTAIKNVQLRQEHEQVMVDSIASIGNLLKKQSYAGLIHTPVYIEIVKSIAIALKVSGEALKQLEYASLLHDIGVIDVSRDILVKKEALTQQELAIVHQHAAQSVALFKPVQFLKPVLPVILHHHERYDGTGYPSGLKKEQIPLGSRIIACVDAFESMVQGRPYRPVMSMDSALQELLRYRGTQFDPKVADIFYKLASQRNFRKLLSSLKK